MPFPLSSLPYGFRQRLRELATPLEAYQLQTAAPHFSGFQPLVMLNRSDNYRVYNVDGSTSDLHFRQRNSLEKRLIPLTDNELHLVQELWVINFKNVDKALSIFNHCVLSPCVGLQFVQMHINLALVEKIKSSLNLKITDYNHANHIYPELCFNACTFDPEAFPAIYRSLFKQFQRIRWYSFLKEVTWLQDMMNENVTGLHFFYVHFESPEMLDVDKTLFVQFCLAQAPHFNFSVETPRPCSDPLFKQKFDNLMSGNFAEVDNKLRHLTTTRTTVLEQFHGFYPVKYTMFQL
uniref:Uncharacterized protein n=1 Tax=Panagrellus redivivus TaxID=6233 RepID=A0A7E4UTH2_PANRE